MTYAVAVTTHADELPRTGATGEELTDGDDDHVDCPLTGAAGDELGEYGHTVVETGTTDVTVVICVWLSGWAGQFVTSGAQLVIVYVWVE